MERINLSFPSIFDIIQERKYENYNSDKESDSWKFENVRIDKIVYPIPGKSQNTYPEYKELKEAMRNCGNEVILVSADFSGIQDTVYTISSKGALKTLRARSFMLELLCEHISLELIIASFNIPVREYAKKRNHIVFVGGGSLCLVLPFRDEILERIEKFKKLLNDWAYEEFGGKLYIAFGYLSVPADELNNSNKFKLHWEELAEKLELDKQRKFRWKLNDLFADIAEPQQRTNSQECQICHRDDIIVSPENPFFSLNSYKRIENTGDLTRIAEEEDVVHELCYRLFRLGDDLTKINQIYRIHEIPESKIEGYLKFPRFGNSYAYYCVKKPKNKIEFKWLVNQETKDDSAATFLYAKYVRRVEQLPEYAQEIERLQAKKDKIKIPDKAIAESTASLTGLASAACGANYIGCLRMDVDDLGKIFTERIANFTLVNLSHLSNMLNIFFKVYINYICAGQLNLPGKSEYKSLNLTEKSYIEGSEKEPEKWGNSGRNVSVVYSGGDDLMIIGAWDEVVELAYDIQYCFSRFSGMGISGGLTLHHAKYPLYQMAKISGEAEKQAKNFKLYSQRYMEPQKNNFALFYSPSYKVKSLELNEKYEKNQRSGRRDYADKLKYVLSWDDKLPRQIVENFIKNLTTQGKFNRKLKENISRGFIYKLFTLTEVWWEHGILYVPQFIFYTGRIKKSLENDEIAHKAFEGLINNILRMPLKNNKHKAIRSLKTLLKWIDLYLRQGKEINYE